MSLSSDGSVLKRVEDLLTLSRPYLKYAAVVRVKVWDFGFAIRRLPDRRDQGREGEPVRGVEPGRARVI